MVLRWIGAQKWIPTIIVAFGLVTTCTAFIKNFADFMVVRVFLGIAEGKFSLSIVRGLQRLTMISQVA
jgi:ABC-type Co2+ transport system permease subunit